MLKVLGKFAKCLGIKQTVDEFNVQFWYERGRQAHTCNQVVVVVMVVKIYAFAASGPE